MSIMPIVQTIQVKAAPARAFELFATRMGEWWPRGRTVGQNPHTDIVIEPRVDGRWFERDADGNETQWGKVLAWEPPLRLLLGWQLNTQWRYDQDFLTEVELSFASAQGGGTLVRLEHRNLERFGADAETRRTSLNGGWPALLDAFARYADD